MLILCAFITPPEIAKKLQVSIRSRGFQGTKYGIKSQLLFVEIIGTIPHSGSMEGLLLLNTNAHLSERHAEAAQVIELAFGDLQA